MATTTVNTTQLLRRTGITERALYYWIRTEIIPNRPQPGCGGRHRWSPAQVAMVDLLCELRQTHSLHRLRPIAELLAEALPDDEFELAHFLHDHFLLISPEVRLVDELELVAYAKVAPMLWSVLPLACALT